MGTIRDEWQSDDGAVRLILGDCLEVLPTLSGIDAVVTDPEYGIGWNPRVNHKDAPWRDANRFDPTPWLSIGTWHVFWGANYFTDKLPISDAWISWVKRPLQFDFSQDPRTYATVELAWTDFGKMRHIKHVWDGGKREGCKQNREFVHPSQKPVEVFLQRLR
jgi:DNA modification methylase